MDILNLYAAVLNAAQMNADKDGVVYRQIKGVEDNKKPTLANLADDKKAVMVMPIKLQTDNPDWSGRVVFHPLRENTQRGESVVMECFRTNMLKRINVAAITLMTHLLRLAATSDKHAKFSPNLLAYLAKLPKADHKALENLETLWTKCSIAVNSVVWVFIMRGGIKDGVPYKRLASVSAPLLEAVTEATDRKVHGLQLRIADVECIKILYELVLPQSKGVDFNYYSSGSNSTRAPTMDAFMNTVRKLAENINDIAMLLNEAQPELADEVSFDMSWVPLFEDIDAFSPRILTIPALPGNEGRVLNEKVEAASESLPPWEPASDALAKRAPKETRDTPRERYSSREPARESRYTAPALKPASADVETSAFYRVLAREKENRSYSSRERSGGYGRPSDRDRDRFDANGYEIEPTSRRSSERDSGYGERRRYGR